MNQPTLQHEDTTTVTRRTLFLALELSEKSWTLALGDGARVREVIVPVADIKQVSAEVLKAQAKFGLGDGCRVVSCYEAGRDGFWVHRALKKADIENMVVDSASIEVDRRMRRVKTDRLDARRLLRQLILHHRGETLMRAAVVPSRENEDERRDGRELERLKKERTAHLCRIRSLLALHGVRQFKRSELEKLTDWEGTPLPPAAKNELVRERERLELLEAQLKLIVKQRRQQLAREPSQMLKKVVMLMQLKGVGETSSVTVQGWG
jgi:transposase